jgi:hypothetical protein
VLTRWTRRAFLLRTAGDTLPRESYSRFQPHECWRFAACACAFGIAALAAREGRETWPGEGCCIAPPTPGEPSASCHEDCCT